MYLTLLCCEAVQPDRSCQVVVTSEKVFLSPFTANNGSTTAACGSVDRQWLLEAPSGQRINVSLLDLSSSSSSTSHSARTVETMQASRSRGSACTRRQFGFIKDKSANRNINICTTDTQPTLYVSRSNKLAIVLTSRPQQTPGNFLISVKGLSYANRIRKEQDSLFSSLLIFKKSCQFMQRRITNQ